MVDSLCRKTLSLAAESMQSSKRETFLAVSDDHYSVKELATKTCSSMGGKLNLIDWPKDLKNILIGDKLIERTND